MKTYGTTRCCGCDQILNGKIQVYDYLEGVRGERVVYCEQCNWRIGKELEKEKKRG